MHFIGGLSSDILWILQVHWSSGNCEAHRQAFVDRSLFSKSCKVIKGASNWGGNGGATGGEIDMAENCWDSF